MTRQPMYRPRRILIEVARVAALLFCYHNGIDSDSDSHNLGYNIYLSHLIAE